MAKKNQATINYETALAALRQHPIFDGLTHRVSFVRREEGSPCPPTAWVAVTRNEYLYVHPKRLAQPEEWMYLMARAILVHAMELWQPDHGDWIAWSASCDVVTARFVEGLKFGRPPMGKALPGGLPQWDEERWYREFCQESVPDWATQLTLNSPGSPTMEDPSQWRNWSASLWRTSWSEAFAAGITESVSRAMEVAAGVREDLNGKQEVATGDGLSLTTRRARDWFISSFPLLGAMVAAFTFVEDADICRREAISVAAVDETLRTVYLNPTAGLGLDELRFVIAHEVLHVALRHHSRRRGRDALLWNAACDFVINDWLIQMQVGAPPSIGLLHDIELRGQSAEEVYDQLANNIRAKRRLMTLAGKQPDMLDRRIESSDSWFTDLDAFCREQLGKGLMLHQEQQRGLIPAGLLEEINAVLQPPIPWEVELARWFDHQFPPLETHRSWARLSRRQSATPDIPRPRVVTDPALLDSRTFGVVLDTSGSMDRHTLAKALGAIASYAEAKQVPAARVICCDAAPYDLGYLPPGDIAGRVQIKGRGGTVLQPGIDWLQAAEDFPKDGPILVITDGDCDVLTIKREHAFLVPAGRRLPFPHRGQLFEMR